MKRVEVVAIIIAGLFAFTAVAWAGYTYGQDSMTNAITTRDQKIAELQEQVNNSVPSSDYSAIKTEYDTLSNQYDELYDEAVKAIEITKAERYTPPQMLFLNCTTNSYGTTTYTNCY